MKASEASPDYHPGSKNIVRDLVHPGLYCFVKGTISEGSADNNDNPPPSSSDNQGWFGLPSWGNDTNNPAKRAKQMKQDFWGREYEDSKYQWLPCIELIN